MRERQKLDTSLSAVTRLTNELHDATELIALAEAENDAGMVADAENSILALTRRAEQMRLESMLSGEANAPSDENAPGVASTSQNPAPPSSVSEGTGGLY